MPSSADETWVEIPGYDGFYEFSLERQVVRSWRRVGGNERGTRVHRPHEMIAGPDTHGYLIVGLSGHRRRRFVPIHRLVCEAVHGPRPPGMECRHLDGDVLNNTPENLVWGTPQENADDQTRHGTRVRGEARSNSKLTEKHGSRNPLIA